MKKKPIAIVGMSCRFPGGINTPDEYWDVLKTGADVIGEIDKNRWDVDYYFHPNRQEPGKYYTKAAGQLDNVTMFDADFFGISPREAAQMDPQQRHLLEMTWEALENGGQIPKNLAGSDCSVFIGISSIDYASNHFDDPSSSDSHFITGNALSIASNRISYFLDLHGPSMSIDTACSSSLVALHQACQSISNGESSASIVGGMHLLFSPFPFIGFSKAAMLSLSGQCRAFDADRQGYVRSEGGAVLFLKSLEQAESDRDPIRAVILASSVNSDGRTTSLAMPNKDSQKELLESIYHEAGINPSDISYIEAHGTGTVVGDYTEAIAIGHAIGKMREKDNPIYIGSAKTNVGHLEPASGMAGLLKAILSLENCAIPASIHCDTPNPKILLKIPFDELNVKVNTEFTPLPETDKSHIMGVNSFGFGGTNAHIILEEYRQKAEINRNKALNIPPLFLTANSENALVEMAHQFYTEFQKDLSPREIYDIAHMTISRRQHLNCGLAVIGDNKSEIEEKLDVFIKGGHCPGLVTASSMGKPVRLAFVFSGNGSQWQGMGHDLLDNEPVFRRTIEKIDTLLGTHVDWSLIDELKTTPEQSRLHLTEVAQPLLFAIQIGLFEVMRSQGLVPEAVIGHSVGEVAAAYAAGALSLEQAVHVIHERSIAQSQTKGQGRMAAVRISADQAKTILSELNLNLEIAAINSPNSITLSGSLPDLQIFTREVEKYKIFYRILDFDYAFHSQSMDTVREPLVKALENLKSSTTCLRLISTVTGMEADGTELDADYWWNNIRQPVQFDNAVNLLIDDDINLFIEIGPHPVLQTYLHECLKIKQQEGQIVTLLRRGDEKKETVRVKEAICTSWLIGYPLDHKLLYPEKGTYRKLPTYPWQRKHFICQRTVESDTRTLDHKLLGRQISSVEGVWENQIDIFLLSYLSDHVVDGTIVFPAAAFAEMALAASNTLYNGIMHEIKDLEIRKPLVLDETNSKIIQFHFNTENNRFKIQSKNRLSNDPWIINVVGKIAPEPLGNIPQSVDISSLTKDSSSIVGSLEHYQRANSMGLNYGPSFQVVKSVWPQSNTIFAEIQLPDEIAPSTQDYHLHPAILDGCFQILLDIPTDKINNYHKNTYLPIRIGRFQYYDLNSMTTYCRARINKVGERLINASFTLFDSEGNVIASIYDCDFKKIILSKKDNLQPDRYRYHEILNNIISPVKASKVPDSGYLSACVKEIFNDEKISDTLKKYDTEILPLCDALASSLADKVLRKFGAHLTEFSIDEFINSTNIPPKHYPYIEYLLNLLHEDGKANLKDEIWKLTEPSDNTKAIAIWRAILADYPEYYRELLLTADFGFNLHKILSSESDTSFKLSGKNIYSSSQIYMGKVYSKILSHIILDIVKHWPGQKRRLRIAEISHGEEAIINILIHELPKEYCDYTSILIDSDYSYNLLQKQKIHINLRVETFEKDNFDIENIFLNGEFDVLIINNILHSNNKNYLLEKAKYLLANSGVLLIFNEMLDRLTLLNKGVNSEWFSMINSNSFFKFPEPDLLSTIERLGFKDITTLTRDIEHHDHYQIISAYNISKAKEEEEHFLEKANDYSDYCIIISDAIGDSYELGQIIHKQISSIGYRALHVVHGNQFEKKNDISYILDLCDPEQVSNLISDLVLSEVKSVHYIYLVSFDLSNIDLHRNIIDEQLKNCLPVITFTNVILDTDTVSKPNFWLITSGAFDYSNSNKIAKGNINPSQGTLWGLGRTLKNEAPGILWKQIDIQDEQNYHNIATHIISEIKYQDLEDEIIIRDESRYSLRLQKETGNFLVQENASSPIKTNDTEQRYALQFSQTGSPEYLQWMAKDRPDVSNHEVEIKVYAAGLNFRDIMYLSGFLPDEMLSDGFAGANLGLECSGVITRVGNQVDHLKEGDEVISFAPSSFASHVVTHQLAVGHKPVDWSFEEAVTVPITFFTAYYALEYLARIKPGEKILIHGAAGGVGLAAIQYAKYCNAEVFATAGTKQKRQFLKLLGVDHVFDSRQLLFSDEINEITDGEGVDIIINSLASGEAIERNLTLLKPFGRFLELGKRDFYENTQIGLKPFRNNIAYFGIDADQLMAQQPELTNKIFNEVMDLFKEKVLRPLPFTQFTSKEIKSAFRFMQQSQHIGKVVVTFYDEIDDAINQQNKDGKLSLSEDASYLITGGYSGLGLATAERLAKDGAKHIYILGRRHSIPDSAQIVVDKLSAQDTNIYPIQCDISDPVMLQKTLKNINTPKRPLKGIIHAAMVLDDCLISDLNKEKMVNVMKPKIQGAWNLHLLTKELSLDFFIMYSSIASYIGNIGQGNYVASNMYLESLAQYRQHLGLPALTISLDAILDIGALSRDKQLKDLLVNKRSVTGITSEQALNSIFENIGSNISNYLIGKPNFNLMKRSLPLLNSPTYSELFIENKDENMGGEENIGEIIKELSTEEAHHFIINILINELSTIMHLDKNRIDIMTPIQNFGIDSLMAAELLTAIDIKFNTDLPVTVLADNSSIENIAKRILATIKTQDDSGSIEIKNENEQVATMASQHGLNVNPDEIADFVDELHEQHNKSTIQGEY